MAQINSGMLIEDMRGQGGIEALWIIGSTFTAAATGPTGTPPRVYVRQIENVDDSDVRTMPPKISTPNTYPMNVHTMFCGEESYWFNFAIPKFTSFFTQVASPSVENGSISILQTVSIVFHKMTYAKNLLFTKMMQNQYIQLIVLDDEGVYHYFGFERGMNVKSLTLNSGTKDSDANGYTVVFEGKSPTFAHNFVRDIHLVCIGPEGSIAEPITNF
jgi:hypothetical protein